MASTVQLLPSSIRPATSATPSHLVAIGDCGGDTFSFSSITGQDIIADFTPSGAAHEIINFAGNAVLKNYTTVISHAAQVGTAVVITQSAGNTPTLNNVGLTALTSADFKFA